MAFMKDILTHNIPIWEECAATPFVQEVQTGKLPLEKFKRYMIQDSIYLKNYARIYGKAIFHADTLREIQLYYSMLNFVNDTESEVRLDYLKQFCITDDDIELIAPLPENQNYMGCKAIVVKGGHHIGNAVDVLFNGENFYHFETSRIDTKNTHGTGCTFSSAIASQLAKGKSVPLAVESAKAYVTMAIEHSLAIGKGCGPTHHFYELYQHGLSKE